MKIKTKIKLKIIRILVIALVAATIFYFASPNFLNNAETEAVGDLVIDWGAGITPPDPIFTVANAAPGDVETRSVLVTNNATSIRSVGVKGERTGPDDETDPKLETILDIVISENGTDLYGGTLGPKTVSEFFTDSAGIDGVFLFNLNSSQTKTVNFKVTFPTSAGNDFQGKSVIFDIQIGISIDIPDECELIPNLNPIFGTSIGDSLIGTSGNDLIVGFEGGDYIDGKSGDDCLIGGTQGDAIFGRAGNDLIFGNEGGDSLNGGAGNDKIFGHSGGDGLVGEAGDDLLVGGDGGDGLDGGLGKDQLFGEGGLDGLRGGANDDYLDGGAGGFGNLVNGQAGVDTCLNGAKLNCEL